MKKWIARAGRRCRGRSWARRWQRLVRWGEQSQAVGELSLSARADDLER